MARQRNEEARRIGTRIAELRERAHLTQPAAAERLKVALRTYQTWEAGDATPRWHNYEKLARLFGVKVEAILGTAPMNGDTEVVESSTMNQIRETLTEINARLARLEAQTPVEPPPDPDTPASTDDRSAADEGRRPRKRRAA